MTMPNRPRPISAEFIRESNAALESDLDTDYATLGSRLARDGVDIDRITDAVSHFHVALPSWGVGTGGTRFAGLHCEAVQSC